MTDVRNRNLSPMNWDMLITPGIPIVTSDLTPNVTKHKVSGDNIRLIDSKQDSVLIDAFMTTKQADYIVDRVATSDKKPYNNLYYTWS